MAAPSASNRAAGNVTYTYPPHTGIEHVVKTDPKHEKLADGIKEVDTTGKQAVWSKWGAKEMPVDWTFAGARFTSPATSRSCVFGKLAPDRTTISR